MLKLSHYLRKYLWAYGIVLITLVLGVIFDMLKPILTKSVVNDVLIGHKMNLLTGLLINFLLLGLGKAITDYAKEFFADFAASGIANNVRKDLFHKVQKLGSRYFDKNNAGETMSRIKSDVDKVWDSLFVITLAVQIAFHVCLVIYNMFSMNWKMAIAPTIMMCIAGLVAILMEKKLDNLYEQIDEEDSVLNDTASENLAGVRTVKAFAREQFEKEKFFKHNSRYYELNIKQSKALVTYYPFFQFMSLMIPVIVLIHGGYYTIKGSMNLGELTAYIQFSNMMTWPMEMLGWIVNCLAYGVASWKRVKKLYSEEPDIVDTETPVTLDKINGDIAFNHVKFEHNGTEILKDVTFDIKGGQTLGIMGSTGSGKTTLVNLLTRIYETTDGTITLDGTDIRKLSKAQLHASIAPVTQDIFLFSNTVKENIKFGMRNTLSDAEVDAALEKAEADFVQKLPEKTDTVIGERGVGLSGGQKQRLTIARALAKKRPVLILDDASSALDMETEEELQKTINKITGVTKIIIAHRISSVCHADKIIVLDNGVVAECGTHSQLLAKQGLYYQTYMCQYGVARPSA